MSAYLQIRVPTHIYTHLHVYMHINTRILKQSMQVYEAHIARVEREAQALRWVLAYEL